MGRAYTERMEELACVMLGCGYRDLDVLEHCDYGFQELMDEVDGQGMEPDLNTMAHAMFSLAFAEVQSDIDDKVEDYRDQLIEGYGLDGKRLDGEKTEELEDVVNMGMDIQEDCETFHNYMDTHASIIHNKDIYEKYFHDEVELFEERTGFDLW